MTELQKAEYIAREAHHNQTDKLTNSPYILHIERVVALVEGSEAKAIAWLHDILEDTHITSDELYNLGISSSVIRGVSILSKIDSQSYDDYIAHVIETGSQAAVLVKVADLLDHLRPATLTFLPSGMRNKYPRALQQIIWNSRKWIGQW